MKYYKNERIINELPSQLEIDGRVIFNPKWHHFESAGWKEFPSHLISVERKFIKWIDGDPVEMTQEEIDEILNAPIPAPTSVPKHKFMGQLALETLQGDNETLKQQLLALGNPEDLLVELVKASDALPPEQIPLAIVEIKLTDNIEMAHPFVLALAPIFGYDTQEKIDDFGRRATQYRFGGG